jgi:MFS family permease
LAAELPSQLLSKKLGPDRWIPMQITLWSIVAASQVAMNGKASFYACRALIGALEGGFIPDLILWMSYFYKGSELSLRLSWFWISRYVTMVVTSVMAFGLLRMRGIHGLEGWRWLFLIEGLITFAIGIASFFLMPASATQTKTWFRPKGWFTEREVGIVVNRVLRDDPGKGDMNNRAGLSIRDLWDACRDVDLWPLYFIGVVFMIPQSTPDQYITLTLRSLGYDQVSTPRRNPRESTC